MEALKNELETLMRSINIDKIEPTFVENVYIYEGVFNSNFEKIACDLFSIKISDLYSAKRNQHIVWCRYFVFDYLKTNSLLNASQIGVRYNKLHSSVILGIRKHKMLLSDKVYQMYYNQFLININQ